MLSARLQRAPPDGPGARMQHKLATQPLSVQDVDALYKLNIFVLKSACEFPACDMVNTFLAALVHTPPDTGALAIYARYAFNVLHDSALALNLAHHVVKERPHDIEVRANLLVLLVASG